MPPNKAEITENLAEVALAATQGSTPIPKRNSFKVVSPVAVFKALTTESRIVSGERPKPSTPTEKP